MKNEKWGLWDLGPRPFFFFKFLKKYIQGVSGVKGVREKETKLGQIK